MALLLQLMQSWIQSAFFEFKSIRTSAGRLLEDFIAVHLAAGEQIQQQQTYASLEELPFDGHRVFMPCLTSLAIQDIIHPDFMSIGDEMTAKAAELCVEGRRDLARPG
jgi:hypothetical protein